MKRSSIIFVSVLALCLIVALVVIAIMHTGVSIYMFADMEECKTIASADDSFSKYTDSSSDKNVSGLTYTDFFAGKYDAGDFQFEIFAYEFDSVDSARAYFDKVTGKNSDGLISNYSSSSGVMSSHIVVFEGKLAYALYLPTSDVVDVAEFLSNVFSIKIA